MHPYAHHELARQRQADLLREARDARLAAIAAGNRTGERAGPGTSLLAAVAAALARIGGTALRPSGRAGLNAAG